MARQFGVRTAINPDAHSINQLDYVHNGVLVARKGWLEAGDIVNCGTLEEVQRFLKRAI
jgi:DNA polymerase (family 10)